MISVVISYCGNDKPFIWPLIEQCKLFSNDVVIVQYDKFFDGTLDEDRIENNFVHLPIKLVSVKFNHEKDAKFHHNHSRYIGFQNTVCDYVLFLDSDEIPDGQMLNTYLSEKLKNSIAIINFKCYWYFREPKYRAKKTECCGLLIHRDLINESLFYTPFERWSYRSTSIPHEENETYHGQILFHHFSWVRTKQQMIKKVQSWGHRKDKNWLCLIEEEFSKTFTGIDFVHSYRFETVENTFNIILPS